MASLRSTVLVVLFLVFHCCQSSLLKDAFKKETSPDENDGINVEVVSEEKNKAVSEDNTGKTVSEGNTDKSVSAEKIKGGEKNVSIKMETIFRPTDCGNVTKTGKIVVLHYTAWANGKRFDSTIDALKRYAPFEFLLGTGAVIKGFEQGLKEMCIGEQRKIEIPPELGYGRKGTGFIPGNATLTYEVQLLDIREPPPQADVFSVMDGDGDKKLSRDEVSDYMKKQAQMHYGAPMDDEYWNTYHEQMVENIFHQEDENEDGTISHGEFSGPKFYHEEL